ncbi:[Fe-Fe] hydrogenase large subunit C-terminal domain-containing protein [Natronincola ferrireducens]|uniref:Iron only hydrogenase large subunit, C-terminal domain n=1 Tax=Natronincola ferrireducens TaxID=393762 RepID=A0A1G9A098_9FIRM|nr:[Fe-Fe] hydrogenase large subunit C-terminal domain-containing protein [Natronincola ferrireducens]SDK20691.1 Iron only hydrogenase large subunit, C-terminal domain [Natronincola ferrireducens]
MRSLIHAIALDPSKCTGCTNCIKRCPTEAIRVKNRKAKILESKCINCGTCINICPFNAFSGITHDLQYIFRYPYRVALIDPVLYSQFNENITPSQIINSIKQYGFNDVYDISHSADLITKYTKNYIASNPKLPVISSSCPAIIRLIQLRFHELIDHILPVDSPIEITAYMMRTKLVKELQLSEDDIGIFYISPCTARIFSFKKPIGTKTSYVDGAISIKSLFLMISKNLDSTKTGEVFKVSGKGIDWARVEGQSKALGVKEYLAIDGIENVMDVLEEIENGKINDLVFLECQACTNGCVGGSLTVENSFVARNRIRRLAETHYSYASKVDLKGFESFLFTETINPLYSTKLDTNLSKAIEKLMKIEDVLKSLPQIDCGACGSPSCRSLAEDIVLGYANEKDCIVNLKSTLELENNVDEETSKIEG